MRKTMNFNCSWYFTKKSAEIPTQIPEGAEQICLPHTWNASDGQDGGSDYDKRACLYMKKFARPAGEKVYLELEGANSVATVYINGQKLTTHEGGYSTIRTDITEALTEGENLAVVCVDNTINDAVYPQMADFTFYGGLYRDVNLITVPESHFSLGYYGGSGLSVEAALRGTDALLTFHAYIEGGTKERTVEFCVRDADGRIAANVSASAKEDTAVQLLLPQAHLWQGVEDPYLYTVTASLLLHNEVIDEVETRLGVREFCVDSQKGFFLNGKPTPLRGVSRHQDRLGAGNALTKKQHEEDAELIRELGANTVRLAHYQHSQYFYDACDEMGLVVWAEIPFISVMNEDPKAHDNCVSQMKELIIQNYNHPSICFWGIANEITIGGENDKILDNLNKLNALVHELDKTRLSTIAQVSMVPLNSPMNHITDVVSYNHYFGWYGGTMEDNEKWLDAFHAMHPDRALGLSEYGAEGIISYHGEDPQVKDYSEDYQALYHEHMAQIISERPWLWATHVWNMFDFGCDSRDEGGVKGRNNKGLMTLDRKIRKDAFYVYKAYWSDEAFVHLAGHRYAERPGEETVIKVYSNQPVVALYVNGELLAEKEGSHVFHFAGVSLGEEPVMTTARAGKYTDSMTIGRSREVNPAYVCPEDEDEEVEGEGVANWFNPEDFKEIKPLEFKEGYFSIKDKLGDIMENEEAGNLFMAMVSTATGMKLKKSMLVMMKGMTLEGLVGMMGSMQKDGGKDTKEMLCMANSLLQKIKK